MPEANRLERMEQDAMGFEERDVEKIVSALISEAIRREASDIHILPMKDRVAVKFRIDGVLYDIFDFSTAVKEGLLIKLKVMSNLVIYRKDIPQDGSISMPDENIELRVTVFPTSGGEKAVIRILNSTRFPFDLDSLGFSTDTAEAYKKLVSKTQGVILLTGPANSGKTTTIYATMQEKLRQNPNCSIASLEDPVEFRFDSISQTQIRGSSGLTYSGALRSLLRQDPDVIAVGEIRDAETAGMVMEAGLTGHLVLSTIHSGTAASVFVRLLEMNIEPFLLASAISGVLAQRLLRRVCGDCGGRGCGACAGAGCKGRVVVCEFAAVNDALRTALLEKPSLLEIKELLAKNGMTSLLDDGMKKARQGLISMEELERVMQN